jgi:hypothetical protein
VQIHSDLSRIDRLPPPQGRGQGTDCPQAVAFTLTGKMRSAAF